MAASALSNGGGLQTVHLRDIPKQLRIDVATELAIRWKLRGMDFALFLLAAEKPKEDPAIDVNADLAALVLAGNRPKGSLPAELAIPPARRLKLDPWEPS